MLRRLLNWFRWWEPAQLKAIWVSLSALAGAAGVTVASDVDVKVSAVVVAIVAVASEIQALMTRLDVWAPGNVEAMLNASDAQRSG